ncbi:MAG: tyrosine-protein phosphatase [Polyangiales bacterium]
MRGFVDLHCHYVPGVDDGVRTVDDAIALLRGLRAIGFDHVVATPHMRPSMFDNEAAGLEAAFAGLEDRLLREEGLPTRSLSAEHFFDEVVYMRLLQKKGLPYGAKKRSALVEFSYEQLPVSLHSRFFDLRRNLLRPVVAHPERYSPFHENPQKAQEAMRKAGGVLLLDIASVEGKYGERARRTSEALLEQRAYYAACSDAHRPEDAETVGRAIERVERTMGKAEVERLLKTGPERILAANILDAFD